MHRAAALLIVALLAAAPSYAAPISYDFSAQVSSLALGGTLSLPAELSDSASLLGSIMTGSFTFDSSGTDLFADVATEGYYVGNITAFSVSLNGHQFAYDPNQDPSDPYIFSSVFVENDDPIPAPTDGVFFQAQAGPGLLPAPALPGYRFGMALGTFSTDTGLLASDSIPTNLLALDGWIFALIFSDLDSGDQLFMQGDATLTPHVATAVTAPAGWPLLVAGLLMLPIARRRLTVSQRS